MPRVDNETFYHDALEAHGTTAEGVQWISEQTQQVRFRVLCELLPDDLASIELVDAGCGFGDLLLYLRECEREPARYLGLDVMAPMIETARARTGCEIRHCDVLQDPLPEADYYLCSGAMNILTWDETQAFIRNCLAASRRGFVFNLLKGRDTSLIYNCRKPAEIQQLADTLNATMTVREGYLAGDFSVLLEHC
ncbi:class I SAM-dependent methyltransferase [Marichromatium bheemlicum]|uniref:Class I SAM-dependent methyltransferase n=1 Tax=Marichromatium bheemlicum TaxID=365339 RepID=A0ABX1I737_9GAMM|nr:class I SAM-dependent methyltransferase [Marichromatium bheemlicum]NKN33302.1 class I SAM-dependent methyltransferase [Marichromatium bheemlicum]